MAGQPQTVALDLQRNLISLFDYIGKKEFGFKLKMLQREFEKASSKIDQSERWNIGIQLKALSCEPHEMDSIAARSKFGSGNDVEQAIASSIAYNNISLTKSAAGLLSEHSIEDFGLVNVAALVHAFSVYCAYDLDRARSIKTLINKSMHGRSVNFQDGEVNESSDGSLILFEESDQLLNYIASIPDPNYELKLYWDALEDKLREIIASKKVIPTNRKVRFLDDDEPFIAVEFAFACLNYEQEENLDIPEIEWELNSHVFRSGISASLRRKLPIVATKWHPEFPLSKLAV